MGTLRGVTADIAPEGDGDRCVCVCGGGGGGLCVSWPTAKCLSNDKPFTNGT